MPTKPVSLKPRTTELRKGGKVVGTTDGVYDISDSTVKFNEVAIKGDLSGEVEYNGHRLRVIRVDTAVGLLIDSSGARGPVWQALSANIE